MTLDTGDINWQNFLFPTFFSRMTGYCKTSLNQRFYICNFSLVLTRALLQFPYLPLSLCAQHVVSVTTTAITDSRCMLTLCLALFEEHGASFFFFCNGRKWQVPSLFPFSHEKSREQRRAAHRPCLTAEWRRPLNPGSPVPELLTFEAPERSANAQWKITINSVLLKHLQCVAVLSPTY